MFNFNIPLSNSCKNHFLCHLFVICGKKSSYKTKTQVGKTCVKKPNILDKINIYLQDFTLTNSIYLLFIKTSI